MNYFTMSCDDGDINDVTIANILDSLGLKATFYITVERVSNLDKKYYYALRNHEIGSHCVNHVDLTSSSTDVKYELSKSKEYLENKIGKKVTMFAYPWGRCSNSVINELKLAGYEGARSTIEGYVYPSYSKYTMGVTLSLMGRINLDVFNEVLRIATNLAKRNNGLLIHINAHSWEFNEDMFRAFYKFCTAIHKYVTPLTNGEVIRQFKLEE